MRCLWLILLIVTGEAHAADGSRQEIEQRIQPVGKVTIESDAVVPPAEEPQKTEPGRATYQQYCIVCHKDGLAGAPKFRNTEDWKPRLDQKKLDGLAASAIIGLNAMPAKGTCSGCSEQDIKDAIQYMLPES
ncbi:c-type cytochrome [Legionella dresdenensis]|uniref:C-type cytochrome n=1 Tax=Legionella dresdenensis TaxID=450200 RepID=A0ABV8CCR1_9GAMM